jgi:glycosyltransferase involved in cell wall biosynthesis
MSEKVKTKLLHNIMAPYKFPLFKSLAHNKNLDFEVLFMSKSAKNRRWALKGKDLGFKYKILPKLEFNFLGKDLLTYIVSYTFPFEFFKKKFDVLIVNGWQDLACQMAFFLCKLTGRKYIIWSESTINEKSWRRTLTLPLVKILVRGADACIAIGSRSKEYFEILGADPKKIFVAYYTVDIRHFIKGSTINQNERHLIKNKLGIRTSNMILYVGQFIERKGISYLLRAYKKLREKTSDTSLLLVGYGPQKDFLMERVKKKKIEDVIFMDHVELSQMPKMYAIADVFVLPSSEETWGLVINEAMAAGLPIITTNKVGASEDLVDDGRNGFVIPARNSRALEAALKRLFGSPKLRSKMSGESRKIISSFTPENSARSFAAAIEYTLKNGK